MEFTEGMRVEVCTSEEGYRSAWFEGVILNVTTYGQNCTDGQHCRIRYDEFQTEDKTPLEEEVCLHSEHIEVRPIEGRLKIQLPEHCSIGDAVEAYSDRCWWRGVIVKLCADAEEETWFVYFLDTCTLESCPRSSLRPAQQWIRGNWSPTPQVSSTMIEQVIRDFGLDKSEENENKRRRKRAVKSKICLERVKKQDFDLDKSEGTSEREIKQRKRLKEKETGC